MHPKRLCSARRVDRALTSAGSFEALVSSHGPGGCAKFRNMHVPWEYSDPVTPEVHQSLHFGTLGLETVELLGFHRYKMDMNKLQAVLMQP